MTDESAPFSPSPDHARLLHALGARLGIVEMYVDQAGVPRTPTSDARRAVLSAMGVDAGSAPAARAALEQLDREAAATVLPGVRVSHAADPELARLDLRLPPGARGGGGGRWELELETEDGERHMAEGRWRDEETITAALPVPLPLGYHRIRLALGGAGGEQVHDQTLIVVPPRCPTPPDLIGEQPAFGVIANLYTVRSRTNWGAGDLTDLVTLARWTGSIAGDFVGINPLHALLNRGHEVSPYCPVSRLFRNPLYIDVARVPELAQAPELAERLEAPELRARVEELRASPTIRYEQVMAVKGMALDALYHVFVERVRGTGSERDRAYTRFLERRGSALEQFAVWMTIAEQQRSSDWLRWPAELRHPGNAAVRGFVAEHAERVDFHCWAQFELDRQLAAAAAAAADAGLRVGIYQDLAIGSSTFGADAWARPELFVQRVSVGAPPDPYAAAGQNWGFPPLDPHALRRDRYRHFIELIRASLEHSGALRIDHVMGLFRLFWIPEARPASDGVYVRYPSEDLLGILALEAARHRALVVGEDLGTVPDDVRPTLQRWGVLSSRVLYFEREADGEFRSANSYPPHALATANTHDMPTLSAFWSEQDIALRRRMGLLAGDADEAQARASRDRDRGALLRLLERERILPHGHVPRSAAELRAAVHGFLWRTPAQLVGLSLDDLAGEVEPVNLPGVGPDRFASWTRKMRADLETITGNDGIDAFVEEIPNRTGPSPS